MSTHILITFIFTVDDNVLSAGPRAGPGPAVVPAPRPRHLGVERGGVAAELRLLHRLARLQLLHPEVLQLQQHILIHRLVQEAFSDRRYHIVYDTLVQVGRAVRLGHSESVF